MQKRVSRKDTVIKRLRYLEALGNMPCSQTDDITLGGLSQSTAPTEKLTARRGSTTSRHARVKYANAASHSVPSPQPSCANVTHVCPASMAAILTITCVSCPRI